MALDQNSSELAESPADGRPDDRAAPPVKAVPDTASGPSLPPGPNHEERLSSLRQAAEQGRNVLLLAASDLLRALAEVPRQLNRQQIDVWHDLLKTELDDFTRLCEQLNVRREHMLAARYVLCTALDEAASLAPWNTSGSEADTWAGMSLLPHFHGERDGGEVVFMLLGRMAHAPAEHLPVLELIHHVLSLGFSGHYRTHKDGARRLESIRHRLYGMVSESSPPMGRELSGRWRGASPGRFRLLRAVPVWASASVLGLALVAQFGWSKYQLLHTGSALEQRILALKQLQPDKAAEVAPAAAALGLRQLLADAIAQGRVTVDESARGSTVVFRGDGMFASGRAALSPASRELVVKVGRALNTVPGPVVVTGHTDNVPLEDPHGINLALSLARAQEVAKVIAAQGVAAARIEATGRGATQPVAGNDTAAGRAQNRRVVIELLPAGAAAAGPAR